MKVVLVSVAMVHPRVGGEHDDVVHLGLKGNGSPPRGRGAHRADRPGHDPQRFTPAWAGSTRRGLELRGVQVGSPPRGRGAHLGQPIIGRVRRFTPAWAGSTAGARARRGGGAVHPRVGGEHGIVCPHGILSHGSPPRGRGARDLADATHRRRRFTPAWAGSTLLYDAFSGVFGKQRPSKSLMTRCVSPYISIR